MRIERAVGWEVNLMRFIFLVVLLAVACGPTADSGVSKTVPETSQDTGPKIYEVVNETMCNRLIGAAEALNAGLITEGQVRQTVRELWGQVFAGHPEAQAGLKGVDMALSETVPLESKPFRDLELACLGREIMPAFKEAQRKSN